MHQPGPACVHRRAPGRARVPCRRLLRPCRGRGLGRVAASCPTPPHAQPRPSAPCAVSARLLPSSPSAPPARPSALPAPAAPPYRIVAWLGTVSQYSTALPLLQSRNIICCIAIQSLYSQASCNTILQYN